MNVWRLLELADVLFVVADNKSKLLLIEVYSLQHIFPKI
jgi:hypothetical protein